MNNQPKIWITSDTHFGHANIIKYCNRPYDSVEEMDNDLIKRWNNVVSKDDKVYHLGDFALGSKIAAESIISKLNGRICLILGNHDRFPYKFYLDNFYRVYDRPIIVNDYVILSHAQKLIKLNEHCINIFGHIHTNPEVFNVSQFGACVCTERWNYTPIDFNKLLDNINKRILSFQ